jgi:ABC-type nickel/cobalt efflux system permease component RcnA
MPGLQQRVQNASGQGLLLRNLQIRTAGQRGSESADRRSLMTRLGIALTLIAALFVAACWNAVAFVGWLITSPIVNSANQPVCWAVLGMIVLLVGIWAAVRKGRQMVDMDAAEDARRNIERN